MRADIDEAACLALDHEESLHEHVYEVAKMARTLAANFSTDRLGFYDRALFADRDRGPTAMSTFGSTDFKAWWMEYGANRPHSTFRARRPLRKACRALGLRFVEGHS